MAKVKITDEQKANHPEIEEIMNDANKYSAIDAVAISEGGKILIGSLTSDIVSDIDTLCAKYSKFTIQEFISTCSDMKNKLDLLRTLSRAYKNKQDTLDLISETLKE